MNNSKIIIFSLLFLTILINGLKSQEENVWNRIQPTPQEHSLFCIRQIPGTETLVTVGSGSTIMYSDDAGETWDITLNPAGLPNNTTFLSVNFYDDLNGYAVANYGRIIRTTDGGQNWDLVYDNITDTLYTYINRADIYLFDAKTAIAIVYNRLIVKTDDGGESWNTFTCPDYFTPTSLDFINSDTGYVVGKTDSLAVILKTIDGGNSWSFNMLNTGMTGFYYDIGFINDSSGIMNMINEQYDTGYIFKSTDYGETWSLKAQMSCFATGEMSIMDENHVISYMHRFGNSFLMSGDGGETWEMIEGPYAGTSSPGNSVLYLADAIYTVGVFGRIYKTTNDDNWISLSENTSYGTCQNVQYTTQEIGYSHFSIRSGGVPGGVLRKTTNGGNNWTNVFSQAGFNCGDFSFLNDNTGYLVVGYAGFIIETYKTNDGGGNWIPVDSFEPEFFDDRDPFVIDYYDESHGIMAYTGKIYKSRPLGQYWQEIYSSNEFHYMTDIHHISADTFVVASYKEYPEHKPFLIWSYDDGENLVFEPLNESLYLPNSIYFKSDSTIFIPFENYNTILKSTDGGVTWKYTVINDTNYTHYKSVYFPTPDTGYAVGSGNYTTMLKTIDGGETWDPIDIPCSSGLTQVRFLDEWHGFVFGNSGVIMETLTGGVVGNKENPFSGNEQIFTVAPNPFSGQIQIELNHPGSEKINIGIFTLNGKLVYHDNISENITIRKITINLTSLSPGIYFCRIVQGNTASTRKIVKM